MTRIPPEAARLIGRLKLGLATASIAAVLAAAAATVTYQRFSTLRPLVTVGGRTVSKREYQALLEQKAGKQVLENLVFGELVRQAATKAHAMPTTKDVDARLALLQSKAPDLAQVVAAAGGPEQFRQGVTTDLALDNLRIRGVTASDAEIARFYAAHQDAFREQARARIALVAADSATDAQTAAHLLSQGVAPEMIAHQPSLHLVGRGYALKGSPDQQRRLLATLQTMKAGDVRVVTVGPQTVAAKVVSQQSAQTPPLAQVRDQVTRLVRLQKAPTAPAELAALYHAHKPNFAADRYADYFSDVENFSPPPTNKHVARLPKD